MIDLDRTEADWLLSVTRRREAGEPAPGPRLPQGTEPSGEQALTAPELFAYPGQPRDQRGRFGSGGGTRIGVSRERPELGGSDIRTQQDIEDARKNPVIAEAERTTTADLEQLGIDVKSQTQVAGVFEGGGEPSLMVKLGAGSSLEDIEVAGAYLVRRNQQDSVIVTVGGTEMERLGLAPNATTIRVEGLPTDPALRERLFADIQAHTPFASWDEQRGTVAVSSFDADIDDGMRAGLAGLALTHGGQMTSEPVHERWYFQDEQLRSDATAYLHPSDPSVLRTPGEVRSAYPGDRTAAIPDPRPGSSASDVRGGGGAGAREADIRDLAARALAQRLTTWAYDPSQPRRSDGKWGRGGARGAPRAPAGGAGTPGPTEDGERSTEALEQAWADQIGGEGLPEDMLAEGERLKGQAMHVIGADLDAQFPQDRLGRMAGMLGARAGVGATEGERVADAMLESWQVASLDGMHPNSVALQAAVAREFDTGLSGVDRVLRGESPEQWLGPDFDMPVLRAGVRSMHTQTQARLDAIGVGDTITLYRGVGKRRAEDAQAVDLNPASSWASDKGTASEFAMLRGDEITDNGTILTMTVPRSRVLAMPGSGIGCFEEHELVVMRADGDRVKAEPQEDTATMAGQPSQGFP